MKKLLTIICIALMCGGCSITFQNAILSHDFSNNNIDKRLLEEDYRIVKMVTGEASATYILAIGGLSERAKNLFSSSYQNMVEKAGLQSNQAIINVTAEKRVNLFFYPIFAKQIVHTTGMVVEFIGKNNSNLETKVVNSAKQENQSLGAIYKVGDIYKVGARAIGIVVDVSADGKHGKLIYYGYQSRKWSNKNGVTGANNSYDGAYNNNILNVLGVKDYPAFALCGNGWYLPSAKELSLIFENLESINISLNSLGWYTIEENQKYWTSTETNATEAIAVENKAFVITNKLERANVIAMKTF